MTGIYSSKILDANFNVQICLFLTILLVVIRIRIIFIHFVPSSTQSGSTKFLVAYMQLYKLLCWSVGQLVDWSVDWSVGLSFGWSISR